jgi:tRNA threonylcarbamoyladenosine biosynthesis protein TsaE
VTDLGLASGGGSGFVSRSESETEELGAEIGRDLSDRDVVYLEGPLGAGKTALARGLARGLAARWEEVASPTFAIVNEYADAAGRIVLRHLDLYRIPERDGELERIGVPDAMAGAPVAVEWPREAIRRLLPPTVEVRITPAPDGTREIHVARD